MKCVWTLVLGALVACDREPVEPVELPCGSGVEIDLHEPADIEELAGCTTLVGSLRIGDSGLSSVDGLEDLRIIEGRLNFFRNPALVDLRGLRNLEVIGQELFVHHNEKLTSIAGLERLEAVGGLLISTNRALSRIGLDRLATVNGDLRILSNPSLSQADAMTFAEAVHVVGTTTITDNQ